MKKHLPVLCFLLIHQASLCQQSSVDLLQKKLAKAKEDTLQLYILDSLIEKIYDDAVWPKYNEKMGSLSKLLMNSEDARIRTTAKKFYATSIHNIGYMYDVHGNIPKAMEYYQQSLKIEQEVGDKKGMADDLNNIGNIYRIQEDLIKALDYYQQGLIIREEIGDSIGIANAYNSFGTFYKKQGDIPRTLEYFIKSLKMHEQVGHKEGIADALLNIGAVYQLQGEMDKALECFQKSLEINLEIGDKQGMANSLNMIGKVFLEKKELNNSLNYGLRSLSLSKKLGYPQLIRNAADLLKKIYKEQHHYLNALDMHELYVQMRDSIINEDTRQATIYLQLQNEFEKKEALLKAEQSKKEALLKAEQSKKEAIVEEEITKQKIIRNYTAGGAIVFSLSAYLIFLFYRRKRNAEMQHKITDSRLRAINAQMNPHFIFNCMHSIQSLISKKDLYNADNCLVRFTKLIRKVLDNSTQKEISLEDDLETLNDYVELEKLRLEYPLDYSVNIDKNLNMNEVSIPPLLIQPLVENAIIHGLKPKDGPGAVTIDIKKRGRQLEIIIADNGVGRKWNHEKKDVRKKYGVPLTKERLAYISAFNKIKARYKIEDIHNSENKIAGTKVTLTLPLTSEN